jgi:predicted ATPase
MPFTGLRLKNFKCFADSGDIPLRPLTLLFGRNNSGKSSVLQSLMLLRQSVRAPTYGPRLNLSGPLYAAGTYEDVVHQHEPRRRMTFGVSLPFEDLDEEKRKTRIELTFVSNDPQPPLLSDLAISAGGRLLLEIRRGRSKVGSYELWMGGKNLGSEKEANFAFPVSGFLPLIGPEPQQGGRPSKARESARDFAKATLVWLEGGLAGLRVLGPFRAPPERHYEYRGATPPTSDTTGRDVVNALIESATTRDETRGVLFRGVNRWLEKVARVKLAPLKPMDKAKKLFQVELRDTRSGRFANFADVGFGIGQALPVIVEGLRTPMWGTFIVQEPEIHLHPDAQLAMADFLIELAQSGRQVIVETHSEHILLRIRRRLLAGHGLSADDVSLIHIGKDASPGGRAVPLKVDDLGQIENWPSGFLQEANSERMALLEEMAAKIEGSGDE